MRQPKVTPEQVWRGNLTSAPTPRLSSRVLTWPCRLQGRLFRIIAGPGAEGLCTSAQLCRGLGPGSWPGPQARGWPCGLQGMAWARLPSLILPLFLLMLAQTTARPSLPPRTRLQQPSPRDTCTHAHAGTHRHTQAQAPQQAPRPQESKHLHQRKSKPSPKRKNVAKPDPGRPVGGWLGALFLLPPRVTLASEVWW